jgi:predicted DCC family thiol-disulfide oxidoreductase YuxK
MGQLDPLNNVVLFDGVCNLCSGAVQFIIKRNSKNTLRFASLQSDLGKNKLQEMKAPQQTETIIFLAGGATFFKSDAVLKICGELDGLYPLLKGCKIFPRVFRDWVYDFIAAHRYQWFGKKEECWLPSPELQRRFIS